MAFGLGTVWLKRRRWRANPSAVAFWQLTIGLAPLALIWLAVSFPPDLAAPTRAHWLALLFLGVVSNGVAYFAWFRLVKTVPASVSGLLPATVRLADGFKMIALARLVAAGALSSVVPAALAPTVNAPVPSALMLPAMSSPAVSSVPPA